MPIQGTLEEAGLPDVLQLLALGRKTGCLTVGDGEMRGEIYLDVGRISYATVTNRRDRLGDILVKNGRITREQLNLAAEEQSRGNKRQLGQILVDSGRIDRRSLEQFVRLQVEEAVYLLFTWKQGEFNFTSDRKLPHQSLRVSLDPESLLLEGARRVDEWSLIEKKVPSFDLVYQINKHGLKGAAAADFTDEQKRILPLLDGTHDVTGLVDVTGLNEFDVGKALYGLVIAGFAQLVERRLRVRHLDYRELLAYVVREAEFVDAQRRRDAGRHIVDCPSCTERLRKIHVRRTEGSPPSGTVAAVPQSAAETGAAAQQQQLSPPAVPLAAAAAAGFTDQRGRDRRTSPERRCERDRRQVVNASWAQLKMERRIWPRRLFERRSGVARGRRNEDFQPRTSAAAPAPTVTRSSGPGGRTTGPRRLKVPEHLAEAQLDLAATVRDDRESAPITPGAAVAEVSTPNVAAAAPAPEQAAPLEAPPLESQAFPPDSGRTGPPTKDIEWIVSPHESMEMIRASRSKIGAPDVGARAPVKPTAAPAAGPAAKPAVDRRKPAAMPAVDRRKPAPNGGFLAARPVAAVGAAPPAPPPTIEPRRQPLHEAPPPDSGAGTGKAGRRQAFPVRRLAIAAAIVGLVFVGFLAGQLPRRGRSGPAAETVAASALAATAAAAAPPRTQAPARPPLARPGAPPQAAVRTPAPAPQGAASQPVQTVAVQPARPATETRAVPQPTVQQPPAQRAAPGPVVGTAPPAAAPTAAPAAVAPPPPAAPTVGTVRGVVRDASGRTLAGAQVSVRGTTLSAVTDGSGAFEIPSVPDGAAVLQATATGYVAGSLDVRARSGATVAADLTLRSQPTSAEPDRELASGGWAPVDRAEATAMLGGTLGAIEGLSIESIAKATASSRPRVRVVQLTDSGDRIVLTQTPAGAAVRGPGPARVTALRIVPPSEAYPLSTGTVSLGNLLITVRSGLAPDLLRALLERLGDAGQGR